MRTSSQCHSLTAILALPAPFVMASEPLTEAIRSDMPLSGASLHAASVDTAVHFPERAETCDVVATYAQRDGRYESRRLRMGLTDGDSVTFGARGGRSRSVEATRSSGQRPGPVRPRRGDGEARVR